MKRILYIPFDHLNKSKGVLKDLDKKNDLVVLVESKRMTSGRPWHKERLFFLISSARHFAQELRDSGVSVEYVKAENTVTGLDSVKKKYGDLPVYCAEPSSFKSFAQLSDYGVQFVPNDFFVTAREDFFSWASKQKSFVMENFYRAQRSRLDVLVTDGKPEGG
ncbi:MAG: deoxyribodipyrimidine photolyase, partial [Microbacteriaceae bacterium]|nr:deoxyribodipyrimidine photolyase [Microbacteriaceae bacterium]